jgi:predicted MFS family arabinose efflux permease
MFTLMNIGFGAGAFLDGLVYDATGSYDVALIVNAGLGAVAAVAVTTVGMRPSERERQRVRSFVAASAEPAKTVGD